MKAGSLTCLAAALGLVSIRSAALAQSPLPDTQPPGWTYTVVSGATFVDECPPCGRPDILEPVNGTFRLRLLRVTPLSSNFAVENIALTSTRPGSPDRVITGSGNLEYGGELALRQTWVLNLDVDDGFTHHQAVFTNQTASPDRLWPMLSVNLTQTNGTFTQVFHLQLPAAPFQEIWFSTRSDLTAGTLPKPDAAVSDGDLLAHTGRVVRRQSALIGAFGFVPPNTGLGLDAVDILPGGEIAFSLKNGASSEQAGQVQSGDLLSDRGQVLRRNQDLTEGFGVKPDAPDAGLDGFQSIPGGEEYFSTRDAFHAPSLNADIGRGDLLSNHGRVVKSNAELLAMFQPMDPGTDFGLAAFHVWPSGEVWFAVEQGFTTTDGQSYAAGDLLSDQGYVVFRNLELLRSFSPLEKLADFGLDALFIVSDVEAVPGPLSFTKFAATPTGLRLDWSGPGRVYRLWGMDDPTSPGAPVGDITPDPGVVIPWDGSARRFFRLQQW